MNISAKTLKAINERLERIETALELNDIGLPMKESEAVLSNNGLDAIFSEWEEKGIKSKLANIIIFKTRKDAERSIELHEKEWLTFFGVEDEDE